MNRPNDGLVVVVVKEYSSDIKRKGPHGHIHPASKSIGENIAQIPCKKPAAKEEKGHS